jgi:hypothetical protein
MPRSECKRRSRYVVLQPVGQNLRQRHEVQVLAKLVSDHNCMYDKRSRSRFYGSGQHLAQRFDCQRARLFVRLKFCTLLIFDEMSIALDVKEIANPGGLRRKCSMGFARRLLNFIQR